MKLSIILDTILEIIELSSIIRYCEKNDVDYFLLRTNQYYLEDMDAIFFQELELPESKYNLDIGFDKQKILDNFLKMESIDRYWNNPFGEGVVRKIF